MCFCSLRCSLCQPLPVALCKVGLGLNSLSLILWYVGSWTALGRLSWLSTLNLALLTSRTCMLWQCRKPPRCFQLIVFDLFCCKDTIYIRIEYGDGILPCLQVSSMDCTAGLDDRVSILILSSALVFCLSLELVHRSVRSYPEPLCSFIPTLCSLLLAAPEHISTHFFHEFLQFFQRSLSTFPGRN